MTTEYYVDGMKELTEALGRFPERLKATSVQGLREIGRLLVPAITGATPRITGRLAESTEDELSQLADWPELTIKQMATTPEGVLYGFFVRYGTRPHIIRPRNARALRFEINGEVVFATLVHHPGNKPNPYHIVTYERLRPDIVAIVENLGIQTLLNLLPISGQPT